MTTSNLVKLRCYSLKKPLLFRENSGNNTAKLTLYKLRISDYKNEVFYLKKHLDKAEIERAKRYRNIEDCNRFIICRSKLKFILADTTGQELHKINLLYLPNKKPYLPDFPTFHFNLSHAGNFALIGTANTNIGVDIEPLNKIPQLYDTTHHIFNPQESQSILKSDKRLNTFYKLWTRKEALVKGLGKGIDDDFIKLPVLDGIHECKASLLGSQKNWNVISIPFEKGYKAAFAYSQIESFDQTISNKSIQFKNFEVN